MLRNVWLILTLAAVAAASALATPVTRAHRRTPALVPVRRQSHSRAAAHTAAAKIPVKSSAKAMAAHGRKQAAQSASPRGRAESRASLRTGKQSLAEKQASLRMAHMTPRQRRAAEQQQLRQDAVVRRPQRMAAPAPAAVPVPEAHVETASLAPVRIGAMPPPLKGSMESLQRQNERNDEEGLERILDEEDLKDRISHRMLVPVPVSSALAVDDHLLETHRYCRPWTALFLNDLAKAHEAQFHGPLQISSAVRTVEYQKQLMHVNGNATAAEGDIVSPHLTGATIDIAKNTMSRDEIAWMRNRLLTLQLEGKLDVEEEFRQPCFHITVYTSYAPQMASAPEQHNKVRAVQVAAKGVPAQ